MFKPKTISDYYDLKKSQAELDFFNVNVFSDNPRFIDPFPFSQRIDQLSQDCHLVLKNYFQQVVDCIKIGHHKEAFKLLACLREPNETRLGLSRDRPRGAGIGDGQAEQIFEALKGSEALQTGFIKSIAECELMIEGIGPDKISDLTTNIIRSQLIKYTEQQCNLHGIPFKETDYSFPCFNQKKMIWEEVYPRLPHVDEKPLLLTPKAFVKISCAMQHQKYYRGYVLSEMQQEALSGGKHSNLVIVQKNKSKKVNKYQLEEKEPCTKQFLYEFSKDHEDLLNKYRNDLSQIGPVEEKNDDEKTIAEILIKGLKTIPTGNKTASDYHNLVIGIIEFIFFPHLFNPVKEAVINEGRKRIDLLMDNAAKSGILYDLHMIRKVPCGKVPFECKNYKTDIQNPEIDQLLGRLSTYRGMFGILCCRHFDDRSTVIKRCKDAWGQQKQLPIPLDDNTLIVWLDLIAKNNRVAVDLRLRNLIDEVWV